MSRSVRAQMIVAALAILTISGCGAPQQQANTSTVTVTSTSASSTNAAAPTATSTVDNSVKVPLYQEFEAERSVGPNGKAINASLAGTEYPDSTGMWVGCNGSAATTTYKLDQKFTKLHAVAGLQPHTPDPLTVNVTISGDDRTLQQFVLSKQNPVPVDVDLSGVNSLVVAAIAVDASLCGASGTPYGALGGAQLSEVAH
jgi:NPCBM/NEW2 domain